MPNDDGSTAKLHRAWLRSLEGLLGKSLSRIADEAKVARSTLTRPLRDDDAGISTLNAAVIDKIVARHGAPRPGDAPGARVAGRPWTGFGEDAAPYQPAAGDPLASAVTALTAGHANTDPWVVKSRALELIGYLPGDIVLVDLSAAPKPGDAVCAQVYDWPRMKAETVMRVLERAAPVDLLTARTLDPALQQPLVVDNDRVIIKGVILPHRLRAQAA